MIPNELIQYYESFGRSTKSGTHEGESPPQGVCSRNQRCMGSQSYPPRLAQPGLVSQPAAGRSIVWKLQLRYV
jgi:hypothetical protein